MPSSFFFFFSPPPPPPPPPLAPPGHHTTTTTIIIRDKNEAEKELTDDEKNKLQAQEKARKSSRYTYSPVREKGVKIKSANAQEEEQAKAGEDGADDAAPADDGIEEDAHFIGPQLPTSKVTRYST